MTWRAGVETHFASDGVVVHLGQVVGEGDYGGRVSRVAQPAELTLQVAEEVNMSEPWLRLPESAARALSDALNAHFGGTSETRQLRKDYDAERGRVDRLITTVITVATASDRIEGNRP